jgi:RimJ/RimL family protein N-acetyltransferase
VYVPSLVIRRKSRSGIFLPIGVLVQTLLRTATDEHFAWMLGEATAPDGRSLAPGGIDDAVTLARLRGLAARLRSHRDNGFWLIVSGGEVVGLCGFKDLPREGVVEIGHGIAASRRKLGHATRAISAMLIEVSGDEGIRWIEATTGESNTFSQGVLRRNGFVRMGIRTDAQDGELLLWRKAL